MSITSAFENFYNFLANLGLVLRDDPPKVVDLTGREFGAVTNGFALSIREIPRRDAEQQVLLSVVIKNEGPEQKTFVIPGWLLFYQIEVAGQDSSGKDGSVVPLTSYGNQFLKAKQASERMEISLKPNEARETDLPLAALYAMRSGGVYRVRVSCRPADGVLLTSNEIVVRA